MADAKTATATDAPVKKARKAQGPRQAKPLNLLLTINEANEPQIELGSYNAQDVLVTFTRLTNEGKKPVLVTWTPPAKSK